MALASQLVFVSGDLVATLPCALEAGNVRQLA